MYSQPVCRSCGQVGLASILSLGQAPLANRLLSANELSAQEQTYPLELVICPSCALVQIAETVPAETLLDEFDHWASADPPLPHAGELANEMIRSRRLSRRSLVIEVGSNDGSLLEHYQQAGIPVLGIEPAESIARDAYRQRGVPTLAQFFTRDLAMAIAECGQPADVLHAHNVLAHVPDLNGFVTGLKTLIKSEGVVLVEVPYVRDLVEQVEYDTIYHEHLCYFSLTALAPLFERHGLTICHVERLPAQGGCLRIVAARGGHPTASVAGLLDEEAQLGIQRPEFYADFGRRIEQARGELKSLVVKLKAEGSRIVGYGASVEAGTLLNHCGLGRDVIDFVVDRSASRQGHYLPGTHLAIHAPEKLAESRADYALVLDWNDAETVLAQQQRFRQAGGRFIIPLPTLRVA